LYIVPLVIGGIFIADNYSLNVSRGMYLCRALTFSPKIIRRLPFPGRECAVTRESSTRMFQAVKYRHCELFIDYIVYSARRCGNVKYGPFFIVIKSVHTCNSFRK